MKEVEYKVGKSDDEVSNMHSTLKRLSFFLPTFARNFIRRIYRRISNIYSKYKYIKKEKFVGFGYRFRFTRKDPYYAYIGRGTILEDFNVWNAKSGEITVGKNCWFGLNNIVMGPVDIGDDVTTGPYVSILGPRHALKNYERSDNAKTVIGNNVWISTGSIILFGVKIGDNVIIGPGSVVTKDVSADSYVAGNPARNITHLVSFGSIIKERSEKSI